jgi:peptidoglycan hydrolase-like protein with peptidoglycan-binding domain
MKKLKSALILILLLCLLPVCAALAKTGRVTASSLNLRKSATSKSKVVGVLRSGDNVTIKGSSGSWYKVSKGSKTGYVLKKYIKITNGSGSGSTSSGKKNSSNKKNSKSSGNSDGTCGPGDSGSAVKKVQQRLKKLGYYKGSIDGDYGNGTKTAVRNFQKRNGLTANGKVNKKTLTKMNSSKAKKAGASDAAGGGSSKGAGSTERLNWFNGGSRKIPKGATFQVKDIKTGIVFTVKRWSGANHIDAEPLNKSETAKMKKIFKHWSWRRRAVLVKYNGHVYAGSMNGMPHGTQTIKSNNFNGHFCIHFYGSKTHGSKKVDAMHQNCVAEAMKHTW